MRIGNGKQGVDIQEYCVEEIVGKDKISSYKRPKAPNTNPIIGYIQPAGDKPQWILWFTKNGDAILYTQRSYENGDTGAVLGDPIRVSARKGAETKLVERKQGRRSFTQVLSGDGGYNHNN
jgi:hypothetical protein